MSRMQRIEELLRQELIPDHLVIKDESYMHNVPVNAESHCKLIAVSEKFNNLSLVARHQIIYNLLQQELQQGLHALSLHLYAPHEWTQAIIPNSPACRNKINRE